MTPAMSRRILAVACMTLALAEAKSDFMQRMGRKLHRHGRRLETSPVDEQLILLSGPPTCAGQGSCINNQQNECLGSTDCCQASGHCGTEPKCFAKAAGTKDVLAMSGTCGCTTVGTCNPASGTCYGAITADCTSDSVSAKAGDFCYKMGSSVYFCAPDTRYGSSDCFLTAGACTNSGNFCSELDDSCPDEEPCAYSPPFPFANYNGDTNGVANNQDEDWGCICAFTNAGTQSVLDELGPGNSLLYGGITAGTENTNSATCTLIQEMQGSKLVFRPNVVKTNSDKCWGTMVCPDNDPFDKAHNCKTSGLCKSTGGRFAPVGHFCWYDGTGASGNYKFCPSDDSANTACTCYGAQPGYGNSCDSACEPGTYFGTIRPSGTTTATSCTQCPDEVLLDGSKASTISYGGAGSPNQCFSNDVCPPGFVFITECTCKSNCGNTCTEYCFKCLNEYNGLTPKEDRATGASGWCVSNADIDKLNLHRAGCQYYAPTGPLLPPV